MLRSLAFTDVRAERPAGLEALSNRSFKLTLISSHTESSKKTGSRPHWPTAKPFLANKNNKKFTKFQPLKPSSKTLSTVLLDPSQATKQSKEDY